MKKLLYLPAMVLLWLMACSPSPQPIEYGADKCDFCRMTIVDPRHAAEAVTAKGRVYKFDAIECMLRFRQGEPDTEFALLLVSDYLQGGVWHNARECTYLVSPELPSPMGANLSALADRQEAAGLQSAHGGALYDWNDLPAVITEQAEME